MVDDVLYKSMIYTADEFATAGVMAVARIQANQHRALPLWIPDLCDYVAPVLPGEMAVLCGQTSNFKTGFMDQWQADHVAQLEQQGRDEIVVKVSLEDTVEAQAHMAFARESGEDAGELARGRVKSWDALNQAALRVGESRLLVIGDSMARDIGYENFYLSNIFAALDYAVSGKLTGKAIKIAAMYVDYLQAMPFDPEVRKTEMKEQRRLQVRNDVYRLRDAGKHFDCPLVVAVQAKQSMTGTLGPDMLTPGVYDGEETSSIGQRAARFLSTWMPKTTHRIGSVLHHGDMEWTVTEDLLFIRVAKQQGRLPAGKIFPCKIDYKTNRIYPLTHERK